MIYVLENSELKKLLLREFYVKLLFRSPRISEYIDISEEVLLLVKFEEGNGKVCD